MKRPYLTRALMLWARCNQHAMQYTPRSFKGARAARLCTQISNELVEWFDEADWREELARHPILARN